MAERDARLTEYLLGLLDEQDRGSLDRELGDSGGEELARLGDALADVAGSERALEPGTRLRSTLLRSLDPAHRLERFRARLRRFFDLDEEAAADLVGCLGDVGSDRWEDDAVSGVRLHHFDGGPKVRHADCGLVHLAPGASYPRHTHGGDEWALVLAGRAEEDSGRVWEPGDLVHRPSGSAHAFCVLGDAPFVFAVILEGSITLEGS